MQLRRFTADSTPAALSAVRLALGDDAIILANRRQGDLVEIIATGQMEDAATMASLSVDELRNSIGSVPDHSQKSEFPNTSKPVDSEIETNNATSLAIPAADPEMSKNGDVSESVNNREHNATALESDTVNISELSLEIESESSGTHPLAPLGEMLQPLTDTPVSEPVVPRTQGHKAKHVVNTNITAEPASLNAPTTLAMEQLTAALAEQTELINNHFKSLEINLWGSSAPERGTHLQQLFSLGIGAELAIRLVERTTPGTPLEVSLRQSFALLKSTIPIGSDKTMSKPGVTVMCGAPGSGKTTALVKLATEHVKRSGTQSIVIICADVRRIGAFEELQAYGRLLGVPTVQAHDTGELESLLNAFSHKQLVLIDHTLPGEDDAIRLPDRLLNPTVADSVRQLFALSATTQSATAESLVSKHCAGRPIQCVLTHLDTSGRLGELFNAIIRNHLPVAYWSDSASVQNPLQKADASVLVASAVAMSRRIAQSPDDEWLKRLIQPSHAVLSEPPLSTGQTALQAS